MKRLSVTERALHAAHPSARGKRLRPYNMDRLEGITPDQIEVVERISLSIFTDVSNAGYSLREALSAIYLSGFTHALDIKREKEDGNKDPP